MKYSRFIQGFKLFFSAIREIFSEGLEPWGFFFAALLSGVGLGLVIWLALRLLWG